MYLDGMATADPGRLPRAARLLAALAFASAFGAPPKPIEPPRNYGKDKAMNATATATATFAGGCFWCIEAAFMDEPGVLSAVSGYSGGHDPSPTYEKVGTGKTGHAEAVQVTYDPTKVSYLTLLEIF